MERLAAGLWRRHRRHYPVALGAVGWLVLAVLFVPVTVAAVAALCGLTRGDAVFIGVIAAPLGGLGPLVAIGSSREQRRAMVAWGRGDRDDPEAAWTAAVHGPEIWTERATVVNLLAIGSAVLPVVVRRAHLSWAEMLVSLPVVVVLFAAFGLVIGTGFTILLRPMVEEVLAELPSGRPPTTRGRWSVMGRFYVAIGSTCFLSGVMVSAFGALTNTRESFIIVTMVVAPLVALYMLVLFGALLVRPTLAPLGDLTRATARVRHGDFGQPVPVTSADGLGDLALAFNEMQVGLRQREDLQAAFGSYVDPVLAQRLVDSGSALFEGEDLVVTVFFADVRNFTAHAEHVEPSEAVTLLNRLFDVVVPILNEHGGHANHYLGDGLLAIFGAPSALEHHADAAVAAALTIQRRVREELGDELRLGIGINTGPVIAGTVGGGGRHEFTVIGDTVNAAARVEQLTKETGGRDPHHRGDPSGDVDPAAPIDQTRRLRGPRKDDQAHSPRRQPVPTIDPITRVRTLSADLGIRRRAQRTGRGRRGVPGSAGPGRLNTPATCVANVGSSHLCDTSSVEHLLWWATRAGC